MKRLKYVLLGLVALVAVVLLVIYLNINGVVRRAVEKQSTQSLNLATTVGGARLSLFGGALSLDDVQIASPQGYGGYILKLDGGDVAVSYSELRGDPVHISTLTLEEPRLLIEQSGGTFNIQALIDHFAKAPSQEPVRLVIGKLRIEDAVVVLRPGLPGLEKEIEVRVPTFEMSNVGRGEGSANGAAIKDVVAQVVTALAEQSAKGNIPEQLKAALEANVNEVTARLKGEAQKKVRELGQTLDKKLPGAGEKVEEAVKGEMDKLLGGKKSK